MRQEFVKLTYLVVVWIVGIGVAGMGSAVAEERPEEPFSYHLQASLDTHLVLAHLRDSYVVINPAEQNTWQRAGYGEFQARHRFEIGAGRAVVDHEVLFFSAPGTLIRAGTAGTGVEEAADVQPNFVVSEAYLSLPVQQWLQIVAGRQFHWEGEGVRRTNPGGLHFSVTDGLHPRAAYTRSEPGFDGLKVVLGPEAPMSFSAAVAVQEVINDDRTAQGPLDDLRYGFSTWLNGAGDGRFGLTMVWQREKMLRGGMFYAGSPGPFTLGIEGAVELYDPRELVVTASPLFGVRGAYHGEAPGRLDLEYSLFGEYHYNGLARIHPGGGILQAVTRDGAAGYPRPGEHYLQYGFTLGREGRWSNTNTMTTNVSDESTLGDHKLEVYPLEQVVLGMGVTWTSGLPASEFGRIERDFILRLSAGIRL